MGADVIVQMRGIAKQYGSVQALLDVDLDLRRGEILGLVGDNAAGKSTLIKILFGAVAADAGEILIDGQPVNIDHPTVARAHGISMVFQDLALFDNLNVASNLFAGRELTRRRFGIRFLERKEMERQAVALLSDLQLTVPSVRTSVARMSGGQRQMIAVGRSVGSAVKVLVLDEPTAALGLRESRMLLDTIVRLRDAGTSIILVTHRLPDILAIGDRIMVLKSGVSQGVVSVAESDLESIEQLIVAGRPRATAPAAATSGSTLASDDAATPLR